VEIIIQQKLTELRDTEKTVQAQIYLWQKNLEVVVNQISALVDVINKQAKQDKQKDIDKE